MRCAIVVLWTSLLLASLPVGGLAGATPAWTFSAPSDITSLSMTPDGSYVLTGGERICFFAGNGTPLWQEGSAELTACSADGRLVVGANGQSLALYTGEGAVIWRQETPSPAAALAFSRDGKRIVVGDRFGRVYFYDADGILSATADTREDPATRSEIHAIGISDRGDYVAVISTCGLFYYTGSGREVWAHEGALEGGTAVAVSGTGSEIAAASDAGIRFLDRKGDLLWEKKFRHPVTALALSKDGSWILSGSRDNTVRCFDREGEEVWAYRTGGWIRDIAVSNDGSRVLAGSMDKQAYLFDGAGNLLDTYTIVEGWINHVALTADGNAGAAASLRRVIGISTTGTAPTPTEIVTPVETP
ncbi:MAG TPA: DUF5711 family protein, partial [Candidatus Methanoculleus thermohydrogenotrophicum]|nr:DUF5711 family protein [Candidatus Methanoculleus thermohydrogenotrophicum]HPZ38974.1 DUF5711 family protein [Candidatus Methanoculleus thermohydrogenotrophicum]HQC92119.1 DUF5711 family protein [Candidatus Methanoculleus thermohydrogenotrophicum]